MVGAPTLQPLLEGPFPASAVPLAMSTLGSQPVAFKKAAVRFDVAESDYLLLGSMGIATFEQWHTA